MTMLSQKPLLLTARKMVDRKPTWLEIPKLRKAQVNHMKNQTPCSTLLTITTAQHVSYCIFTLQYWVIVIFSLVCGFFSNYKHQRPTFKKIGLHWCIKYLPDTTQSSVTSRIKREAVIAIYTARQFLPGFFARQFFLILFLMLPFFDLSTDWYNAGSGLFTAQVSHQQLITVLSTTLLQFHVITWNALVTKTH